jgi:hypothetical protein
VCSGSASRWALALGGCLNFYQAYEDYCFATSCDNPDGGDGG